MAREFTLYKRHTRIHFHSIGTVIVGGTLSKFDDIVDHCKRCDINRCKTQPTRYKLAYMKFIVILNSK